MALSRTKEEKKIVALLFLVLFVGVADSQILSPLLPAIRLQFARSSSDMGYLFSGYSFSACLSVLIWGPLSDAFGRRRGLLGGLVVFAIGSVLTFFSSGYSLLLAGRIVTGMGASMLSLNSISYAADYFPYATRGWAMGSIFSSYFAALILGVPLGSWLGERLGWQAIFGIMGGMALALLPLIFYHVPPIDNSKLQRSPKSIADYSRQYIDFFRFRSSVAALLCSFFSSAGTMGFLAFLGSWLHDAFGLHSSQIGLVFLISGGAAVLASPLAGSISDKIGKPIQFVCSSFALALFLLILPGMNWGIALFVVFGVISLAAAFRQGPMEAVLTDIVPSATRGSFVALKNSFSQLGIGMATLMSGILFEASGYGAVCSLGAAASLLAALSMLLIPKNR
jgi:DHA1 family purine base/nucleoside efflux pump-like MFS transporter